MWKELRRGGMTDFLDRLLLDVKKLREEREKEREEKERGSVNGSATVSQ
jgi:hypothetical protein